MSSRAISLTLGSITVVAVALGFGLQLDGFSSNVLAEVAGVALSVLIALTLVEALLRRERRSEWGAVIDATSAAIATRAQSVALDFYLLVDGSPDAVMNASAPTDYAAAFDLMAARMRASQKRLGDQGGEAATTGPLHDTVREDLGFIRDVLAPRVMQIGQDPELVQLLVALEVAEREWHEGLRSIQADWGFPNELAWERAAATLEAVARLYRHVAVAGTG